MAFDKVIQLTWLLLTYHITMTETENDPKVEGEDGEALETPGYEPSAIETLAEIKNTDADDDSLVRYKNHLLGSSPKASDHPKSRNVVVEKMVFLSEGREIELDLTDGTKLHKLKDTPIRIKEGCEYRLKFVFKVLREDVDGLKLFQTTFHGRRTFDVTRYILGSYWPMSETRIFVTDTEIAPICLFTCDLYTVKSVLSDGDRKTHVKWEWSFDIKEDWD